MSSIAIPTPFSNSGLLYVCSGYVGDKVRPVFAINRAPPATSRLKPGETNNQYVAWYLPAAGPYNPSPLLYGDYLYVLYNFGFLSCYDTRTGQPFYQKQRVREGTDTSFTASPWAANGKIFGLSEDGDTFVFQAGPEYKLLRTNSLDEMCMATPAIAGPPPHHPHADKALLLSRDEVNRPHPAGMSVAGKRLDGADQSLLFLALSSTRQAASMGQNRGRDDFLVFARRLPGEFADRLALVLEEFEL